MNHNAAIRGKCVWWREQPHLEDKHDLNVKQPDKRIECSCFVEGDRWCFIARELPKECPKSTSCRYYVKGY